MKTLCKIKDILKALNTFEQRFEKTHQVSLNEAMLLCVLHESKEEMTPTNLAKSTDLSTSHTSKVIRILEEKKLIQRKLGHVDRRLMYFHLTEQGSQVVTKLQIEDTMIPEVLRPLFG